MQKQKLIRILHQMVEDEFDPNNVQRLLENSATTQALEVFIPNTNNAFMDNEGKGLTNIQPLITTMKDNNGQDMMCLHVFLDESIGEKCIPDHLTKDISILKSTFGWASITLPKIAAQQKASCMILLHHIDDLNDFKYESPVILSPINLLNIAKVLYANPHILTPENSVEMWNMISAKELKQYSYQFACENILINRYGCLVFDRDKPQGAIKRWFNMRRQLSVVVDSNFAQ